MQVSVCKFTHNSKQKSFTCELSDLGPHFTFDPIYTDACDVGLVLVSDMGTTATFYLNDTYYDASNEDIQYWFLKPTTEEIRKNPRLDGYTMTIFND